MNFKAERDNAGALREGRMGCWVLYCRRLTRAGVRTWGLYDDWFTMTRQPVNFGTNDFVHD